MRRVLAMLAFAVLAAGCGGDEASTSTSTTGPVEDQLPFAETTTSVITAPPTTAATAPPTTPAPVPVAPLVATAPPTTRATAPPPTAAPATSPPPAASASFANCTAARAAGAAPVHRGDPGYGPHLDRDGDGVGCEN